MSGEGRINLICVALMAAALFFVARWTDHTLLATICKPIPALVLAALVLTGRRDRVGKFMGAGLVFGALGDTLLELGPGMFVPGLGAFLVDHVLVTCAFTVEEDRPRLVRALPFAAFGGGMIAILGPRLGEMAVPVAAYALVIGLMMWRAAARLGPESPPRPWLGLFGAATFAVSDAMIAVDTFYTDLYTGGEAVMITYWLAQALITLSVLPSERR